MKLADCDVYGATDPSMGKLNRNADPSAVVSIAAYPSRRISPNGSYHFFYVIDADIRRRHPSAIRDQIINLHSIRKYERYGIEAVQFQELFADDVQAAAPGLQIVKLKPHCDKKLRIQKLSPLIHCGKLLLGRSLVTLYDQLRLFPQADHDDGGDAVELCLQTIGALGPEILVAPAFRPFERPLHPHDEQIREAFPGMFENPEGTCGTCINAERGPGGELLCTLRDLRVTADLAACSHYEPALENA